MKFEKYDNELNLSGVKFPVLGKRRNGLFEVYYNERCMSEDGVISFVEIKEEPTYAARWIYEVLKDNCKVDNVNTELEAMEKCEKIASENTFDTFTSYRKVCIFAEVK